MDREERFKVTQVDMDLNPKNTSKMNRAIERRANNPYKITKNGGLKIENSIWLEGAEWADNNPSEETIRKVFTMIYDNADRFSDDTRGAENCIKYIKEHWNNNESEVNKD